MESLGYVLAYLFQREFAVAGDWRSINLAELPCVLADFITTSRRLSFTVVPDYVRWIERFKLEMEVPFEKMLYDLKKVPHF